MHRHALTDAQWDRLRPLLPRRAQGRQSILGDRLFVDAVIFRARTGIQWRDLPERFGNWKTVYNRFRNWAAKNVWMQVFRELQIDVDAVDVGHHQIAQDHVEIGVDLELLEGLGPAASDDHVVIDRDQSL